jgi:aryl-alcohol dehydrogenase-like predicted oxidoreductase
MQAIAVGTHRYTDRFAALRDAGFYRTIFDLNAGTLGIGTYLGNADDATDCTYTDALIAAGENGINWFDTAINYRRQRSERCVGAALRHLQRDEIVVSTKAGFLTPGALPGGLAKDDVVGGMHSMAPLFLSDQIERSRANLGVDTIDVFYLHNPETQLGFLTMEQFEARIRRAFAHLERTADEGKIHWYGAATWEAFRSGGAPRLRRLAEIAAQEGGPEHHFRFIQLPFNLNMVEAYVEQPESVLEAAARLGIAAIASATLMQTQCLNMPEGLAERAPGLQTDAQRAIQFTRSTPGIAVALVGMSSRQHVLENLGVARVPPLTPAQYQRFYR